LPQRQPWHGAQTPPLDREPHLMTFIRRVLEYLPAHAAYLLGLIYSLRLGYGFPRHVGRGIPLLPRKENAYLMRLERYAERARRIISQLEPDVVHGHFLTNYGYIAARTGFRPLVVSAWGSDVLVKPQEYFILKMILRHVVKRADLITSVADVTTRAIIGYGADPQKIATFPYGIDDDVFYPDDSDGGKNGNDQCTIFCSRRLKSIYNVGLLIRAIPYIAREIPNVRVFVNGDGPLRSTIEALARELKVQSTVTFLDWLSPEELAQYYRTSNLYVSTALSDGTSVSLLEAMASGAFPIVSDLPGNREWIKDHENGYLIPTDDPRLLADRVVRAFRNVTLRMSAARKNIDIVRQRSLWKNNMKVAEEYYSSLIGATTRQYAAD
ncbi:MAG: glycosyltransferase, partial [Candidatus Binatia bacterium]